MNKLFAIVALVLVSTSAMAQSPSYSDVIRTCGAEWRERADKATNKGRDAWNEFRKSCVARKGYVTKAAKRGDFARVPDKQ